MSQLDRMPPIGATVQAYVRGKGIKTGVVTAHDVKDGQSIFDFETEDGSLLWGFASGVLCWERDGQTTPTHSWRCGGTHDFQTWRVGQRINSVDELQVGTVIFDESQQFDAVNLCIVTKVDFQRGIAYARFVHPENLKVGRLGYGEEAEFAIWQHELVSALSIRSNFYLAMDSTKMLLADKAVSA